MDEQYIKDLYNNLGGQQKFGQYADFKELISTDGKYREDFFNAFGEDILGAYKDFDQLVKKKEETGPPTQEDFLFQEPEEPWKDLSIEQKKQGLQSKYKDEDFDVTTLTKEDVYPQTIGLQDFAQSQKRKSAYIKKTKLDLEEKFMNEAKALAESATSQDDLDKKLNTLSESYTQEYDKELSGVGIGLSTGEGQTKDDMIKNFEYLSPEDAKTILDETEGIMNGIRGQYPTAEAKISALEQLSDYFVSKVPPESQKALRGEINALIARKTMFKGSHITPFAAKQQAEILKNDILSKYQELQSQKQNLNYGKKADRQKAHEVDRQLNMYDQSLRLINNIEELPDDEGTFREGLARPWRDGTVASLGLTDVFDAAMQLKAANKVGKLKDTDADRAVINVLGLSQIAQQDIGDWYRRGEMISEMLPFMAQFVLTSGIPGVGEATAKKVATKTLKDELKKSALKKAAQWIGKTAKGAAIRTPFLTLTHQRILEGLRGSPKYDQETGTFTIDEKAREGLLEAIAKGIGTGFSEAFFEQSGELVGKGVTKLAKGLGIKLPKTAPWLREVKDRVAFNGFLGEFIEELPTEFFQGWIENGSPQAGLDQLSAGVKDIFWVTGIVSGAFGGLTGAANFGQTQKEQALYKQLGEDVYNSLEETIRTGTREDVIAKQKEIWESLPKEQQTEKTVKALTALTGQAIYQVSAEQAQENLKEGVNEEFKKEGEEPIGTTPTVAENAQVEEGAATTEESTGVQEEEKVSPQPEKETTELRAQPETIAKELNVSFDGVQDLDGVKQDQYTIQEGKAKDATFNVPQGSDIETVKAAMQETKDSFKETEGGIEESINKAKKQTENAKGTGEETKKTSSQEKLVEGEEERLHLRGNEKNGVEAPKGAQVERERVRQEILDTAQQNKLTEEQVDESMNIFDAQAKVWAETLGKTTEDYYKTLDVKGEMGASQQAKQAQKRGRVIKGEFKETKGRSIVGLFKKGDVSTLLHEIAGHRGRRLLSELAQADEKWSGRLNEVEKWAGVKQGKWTVKAEEKFARAFENYIKTGKLPTKAPKSLKETFDKLKQWMQEIYKGVNLADVPTNIQDTFSAMLGVEGKAPTEAPLKAPSKPTENKPTTLFQEAQPAVAVVNGFYSNTEKALSLVPQDKMTGNKWRQQLLGRGAKAEELDWTTLSDLLEKNKDKAISREEVESTLRDNKVEIKEVTNEDKDKIVELEERLDDAYAKERAAALGDLANNPLKRYHTVLNDDSNEVVFIGTVKEVEDKINFSGDDNYIHMEQDLPSGIITVKKYNEILNPFNSEIEKIKKEIKEEELKQEEPNTKYSQYQLPGAKENYKEVLVTLPQEFIRDTYSAFQINKYDWGIKNDRTGERLGFIEMSKEQAEEGARQRTEEAAMYPKPAPGKSFQSGHFDEPNILVHLRTNERTDENGDKVLFVEEIQSDWGQQGREKGFATGTQNYDKLIGDFNKKISDKYNLKSYPPYLRVGKRNELMDAEETAELERLSKLRAENNQIEGVPTAPFVTDTNAWTKLGLKVALKQAVQSGAKKLAWTTGEQQNERYDLSKQVDEIQYFKSTNPKSGYDYGVKAFRGGSEVINKDVLEKDLEGIVGKEITQKIINDEGGPIKYGSENISKVEGAGSLRGEDLRVGGKGMIGFYGSPIEGKEGIIGASARKLVKDLTGKKEGLSEVKIETEGQGTQQSIDITPELADAVGEGMPLFQEDEYETERGKYLNTVTDRVKKANPNLKGKELQDAIRKEFNKPLSKDQVALANQWLDNNKTFSALSEARRATKKVSKGESTTEERKSLTEPKKQGKTRQRGTQQKPSAEKEGGGIFWSSATPQQKVVKDMIEARPELYEQISQKETIEAAQEFINKHGIATATELLENKSKVAELRVRQAARFILVDYYSRVINQKKSLRQDQSLSQQKTFAFEKIEKLEEIISKEATEAGQGIDILKIWRTMQPEGLLEYVKRKILKANGKKMDSAEGFIEGKNLNESIGEAFGMLEKDAQETIKELLSGKPLEEIWRGLRKIRPQQRKPLKRKVSTKATKEGKAIISQAKKRYIARKQSDKPLYQTEKDLGDFGDAEFELADEIIKGARMLGNVTLSDIHDKLIKEFKDVGIDLTAAQISAIFSMKIKGNKTWRSAIVDESIRRQTLAEMKDLGLRAQEIIKQHWSIREGYGRTLKEKLMDEGGLSEKDAAYVAKRAEKEFHKILKEKAEKKLRAKLGMEDKLPKEIREKQTIIDRMIDLINLGALEEDEFKLRFAEKFGVTNLSDQQVAKIKEFADALHNLQGTGEVYDDMAVKFGKYVYELMPRGKFGELADTWTAIVYANVLAGPFTHLINILSAGSNVTLDPIIDFINPSRIKRELKNKKRGKGFDMYSPLGYMGYGAMAAGTKPGWDALVRTITEGNADNKYLADLATSGGLKVPEFERTKHGRWRFNPIRTLKIKGREINLRPINALKYFTRSLAAEDAFMTYVSMQPQVRAILRDVIRDMHAKSGNIVTGKELTNEVRKHINSILVNKDDMIAQIDKEVEVYKEQLRNMGMEIDPKRIDRLKKARFRQLTLEKTMLTPADLAEAEEMARTNIFTGTRNGLISHAMRFLQQHILSSRLPAILARPFIMFTRVIGNVSEMILDGVPFYGLLRQSRMGSPSSWLMKAGLLDKSVREKEFYSRTDRKAGVDEQSRAYYKAMARAWVGTLTFLALGAATIGNDDDDFIQITGSMSEEKRQRIYGREKVTPPYTLRIGKFKWDIRVAPMLAGALGLIGNINDAIASGMDEDETWLRTMAAALSVLPSAYWKTLTLVKDQSYIASVQKMLDVLSAAGSMESGRGKYITKNVIDTYLGYAGRALPQNNNLLKQMSKFFDRTSYSKKSIEETLMYTAGLEKIANNPVYDVLGYKVESWPGKTYFPYDHWLNLVKISDGWRFLIDYDAIPASVNIYGQIQREETFTDPKTKETMTRVLRDYIDGDEATEYTRTAGLIFRDKLHRYMENTDIEARAKVKEEVKREKLKGLIGGIRNIYANLHDKMFREAVYATGVQLDVKDMWADATKEARQQLFMWSAVSDPPKAKPSDYKGGNWKKERQDRLDGWELMKEFTVIPSYRGEKTLMVDNKEVTPEQAYLINSDAIAKYAKRVRLFLKGESLERHLDNRETQWGSYIDKLSNELWTGAVNESLIEHREDILKERKVGK